ncbi:MAG: AtpZ/AtpI family protein [Actinomycetes bacterium]
MARNTVRPITTADVLTVVVLDVAAVAIGILLGWLLDRVAQSAPLLSLLGLIVGLIVAVVLTWTRLTRPADDAGS